MRTHEDYVKDVATFVVEHADLNPTEYQQLAAIKLVYGSGPNGTRGVTFFNKWKCNGDDNAVPFVEVSAFGQRDPIQLAGTTVHELAHVLAGWQAGHDKGWKDACERLGLQNMQAAGTDYQLEQTFQPWLRDYVAKLAPPDEGAPVASLPGFGGMQGLPLPFGMRTFKLKGCQAGVGTRGGKSRGIGSGSRLRKYQCPCGQIIRAATDSLQAKHTAKGCNKPFVCQEA